MRKPKQVRKKIEFALRAVLESPENVEKIASSLFEDIDHLTENPRKRKTKRCSRCLKRKKVAEFAPRKDRAGGYQSRCRQCQAEYMKANPRLRINNKIKSEPTPELVAQYHWAAIQGRVGKRTLYKNRVCTFTLDEFKDFVRCNWGTYMDLFNKWKESGFDTNLSPTIDRMDEDGDYDLEKIRFLPQNKNYKRKQLTTNY